MSTEKPILFIIKGSDNEHLYQYMINELKYTPISLNENDKQLTFECPGIYTNIVENESDIDIAKLSSKYKILFLQNDFFNGILR